MSLSECIVGKYIQFPAYSRMLEQQSGVRKATFSALASAFFPFFDDIDYQHISVLGAFYYLPKNFVHFLCSFSLNFLE